MLLTAERMVTRMEILELLLRHTTVGTDDIVAAAINIENYIYSPVLVNPFIEDNSIEY